jgi:rhomboid-related protein 1/2/3
MVRRVAKDFLTDEADRRYYAESYHCCPPPLFVPLVTLLEVGERERERERERQTH